MSQRFVAVLVAALCAVAGAEAGERSFSATPLLALPAPQAPPPRETAEPGFHALKASLIDAFHTRDVERLLTLAADDLVFVQDHDFRPPERTNAQIGGRESLRAWLLRPDAAADMAELARALELGAMSVRPNGSVHCAPYPFFMFETLMSAGAGVTHEGVDQIVVVTNPDAMVRMGASPKAPIRAWLRHDVLPLWEHVYFRGEWLWVGLPNFAGGYVHRDDVTSLAHHQLCLERKRDGTWVWRQVRTFARTPFISVYESSADWRWLYKGEW